MISKSRTGFAAATSTTCTSTRVRSTCRRNASPRPAPELAPFDQAGQVGDRRPAVVGGIARLEVQDAEVGLERGEGVVGDLGRRRGDGSQQRRLAGVGQSDQPDVGDQPKVEPDTPLLAGQAASGVLGRLVRASS